MTLLPAAKTLARRLILPRPALPGPRAPQTGLVVVAGMFRTGSGLGRAALSCFEALEAEGYSPRAVDLSAAFNQVDTDETVPCSEMSPASSGTVIIFANPPELERALMTLGLRRWHNWRIIGAWSWEFATAPAAWAQHERYVSEIWAPSAFVAEGFSAAYNRPVHNVPHFIQVLPPSSDPAATTYRPLSVLALADGRSSLERKNILASVRIFKEALPPPFPAELVIKCRNLQVAPRHADALREQIKGDSRIRLIDVTLNHKDQSALVDQCDILLSPHRCEGFGVHLAEAMARGKCVIATGWSGNLEFMWEENAALIPYTLVPVADAAGIYPEMPGAVWAEPDIAAAVAALADLAQNPEKRRRMGAAARTAVARRLSPEAYRLALG